MPLITNKTTRRSFLRTSSCLLALPFLDSVAGTSSAAKPKRLVFMGGGYGFTHAYHGKGKSFFPDEAGKFAEIGLTHTMKPLERHKNDITMIGNLTNLGVSNPHGGSEFHLNCGRYREFESSISCDQVAARTIGKVCRFPSLVLSGNDNMPGQGAGHGGGYSLSADERGRSIPAIDSPLRLYKTLFAQKGDSSKKVLARINKRKSILDFVHKDAANIHKKIAKEDAVKLDQYFTSIREIEQTLSREKKWANVPKQQAPFPAPSDGMDGDKEVNLIYDMMILALQSDMTRVISYRQPVASIISSLDISLSAHSLSHYGSSPERRKASERRDAKIMDLYAGFIDRLKQTKDAEGQSLFDSTIVNYGSNLKTGHGTNDIPIIMSGGGATNIRKGEHIILPKKNTSLGRYWLTLLQEAGVQTDKFNYDDQILPEILA
ncbi:MAG: DUF1552 domain-containing protein [Lentisphaerales bacterium]|nr:DUF1552 domain-containing protein [Lentisphaerales bacterium]